MSSQLNTLDHTVMGILLKSDKGLSIPTIAVLSESPKHNVRNSLFKLMDLGFVVRRVGCGAFPLYSAVIDCPYFPPVAAVTSRVFSFENPELKTLVAQCDEQLLTNI